TPAPTMMTSRASELVWVINHSLNTWSSIAHTVAWRTETGQQTRRRTGFLAYFTSKQRRPRPLPPCPTGLIPDTLDRADPCHYPTSTWLCHCRFRSDAEPRTRRSKAQETAVAIDDPEIAMAEACDVATALMLGETYELAGECFADKDLFALPLDHSVPTHAPHLLIGVVPRIFQARRHSAGRRSPMCGGRRLLERFMRTFLVVVSTEAIEAALLLNRRCRGRFGQLSRAY